MFKKKKKEDTAEELKQKLAELEGENGALPTAEVEEPKTEEKQPKKKAKKENEPQGETEEDYSLDKTEIALAVNVLAERPELKVYNDFVIGQKIADIINSYNKAVKNEQEQSSE